MEQQEKTQKQRILEEVIELSEESGSMMGAIIEICDNYGIDIETISYYIRFSKEIKEKLRLEGEDLRMLKRE